jgi:lambda repressor-like predicted transcriptional regulator
MHRSPPERKLRAALATPAWSLPGPRRSVGRAYSHGAGLELQAISLHAGLSLQAVSLHAGLSLQAISLHAGLSLQAVLRHAGRPLQASRPPALHSLANAWKNE